MHERQRPVPASGSVIRTPMPPMAQIRARWRVRMLIEAAGQPPREHDVIVDACSSDHAIKLARNDFYGRWATPADRERLPLRVLELLQVDV